ncbi:MAG: histidine kinase, partial [Phaeodactylibacter sp.]|nr:histidine kinase [Phaeodactylibacter sp.]
FLFNTLNTISSLMEVSIKDARKIVSKLGQLLRTVLEKNKRNSVPLSEELDFIRSYLDIEQVRFHDRLEIHYDLDPATLDVAVPSFLLQPLVENAVRHGFANQTTQALIEVCTRRLSSERIEIIVRDNGKGSGRPIPEILKSGIGIQNVKERLELLFGEQYQLEINTRPEHGFEISIQIPDVQETPQAGS